MRLIDADALMGIDRQIYLGDMAIGRQDYFTIGEIEDAPTVDAVPVVWCKNCRHRPTKPEKYRDGFDLEFPDGECPCKCEDPFYSWYPFDDWFCPKGERKGGDADGLL